MPPMMSRKFLPTRLIALILLGAGFIDFSHAQYSWTRTSLGGGDKRTSTFNPNTASGADSFQISYDFYRIPDSIRILYGSAELFSTGYISGSGRIPLSLNMAGFQAPAGSMPLLTIIMNEAGALSGTDWDYTFLPVRTTWTLKEVLIDGPNEVAANASPALFVAKAVYQRLDDTSNNVLTESRPVAASWSATAPLQLDSSRLGSSMGALISVRGNPRASSSKIVAIFQGKEASKSILVKSVNPTGDDAKELAEKTNPAERADSDIGGPIDTATGAESFSKPLLSISGARDFTFGLDYSSIFSDALSSLGNGWSHHWDIRIEESNDGQTATVIWSSTRRHPYQLIQDPAGAFYASPDDAASRDTLRKLGDGSYTITRPDQTRYVFGTSGSTRRLVAVENSRGQRINFTRDGSGRVTRVTEPISSARLDFTYTGNLITRITDQSNRQVTLGYTTAPLGNATASLLTSITLPDGALTRYTYNSSGKMETVIAADGATIYRNTYDQRGRVISQDDGLSTNKLSTFAYKEDPAKGLITTTVTDRNGARTIYVHDYRYRLLSVTDPLNQTVAYSYVDNGNRATITDPLRRTTRMSYDSAGRVTSILAPDGSLTSMEYDANGNVVKMTNALGQSATFRYDSRNNPIESIDFAGKRTARTFDGNSLMTSETSPLGHRTSFSYSSGRLATVTNPLNQVTRFAYDTAGRVTTITDPANNITRTTYTPLDLPLEITDPLGKKTTFAYDSRGQLLTTTDPLGAVTTLAYDANRNLLTSTDALGGVVTRTYDGEDRLLSITDPRGNTTRNTYDAAGRLVAVTNALGQATRFSYDAAGNLLTITDPAGAVTTTAYSTAYSTVNLPVSVRDALGRTTNLQLDPLGRAIGTTDPAGRTARSTYDELGRVTAAADPMGLTVRSVFDADGRLTALTNAAGAAYQFTYDAAGRQTRLTTPLGRALNYTYDSRGLISRITQPSGKAQNLTYDAAGRPTTVADTVGTIQTTYDAAGRPLTVTENGKSLTRTYDLLGLLTSFTDGDGNRIEYTYDAAGNLTTLRYPGGRTVTYTYDALNRMSSVTDWEGRRTSYAYDAAGRLVLTTRPNGTSQQRSYDRAGQLIALREAGSGGRTIASYAMRFDPVGQITSEVRTPAIPPAVPSLVDMAYDADDRLFAVNDEAVTQDPDGNMLRGPLGSGFADFTYDARNRLISAGGLTYSYDAENRRVATSGPSGTTNYINDPNAALWRVLEIQPPAGPSTFCVYGIGLIYTVTEGEPLYHHYDLRGSTVATTNHNAVVTATFAYDAYGKQQVISGTANTPFLFVGKWGVLRETNGLSFSRARFYDPETHRFVNADPIGFAGGINWYAYASNSPIVFIDPSGFASLYGVDLIAARASNAVYDLQHDKNLLYASEKPFNYNPIDGFKASLTRTESGNYMLAFAGTEDWHTDMPQNLSQGVGFKTSQYEQAIRIARQVQDWAWKHGHKVTITGHSLGGGLASAASYATGLDAITFNAAGLSSTYKTLRKPDIRSHYVIGEVLTHLQQGLTPTAPLMPNAAGKRIMHLPDFSKFRGFKQWVVPSITLHSMDQFLP